MSYKYLTNWFDSISLKEDIEINGDYFREDLDSCCKIVKSKNMWSGYKDVVIPNFYNDKDVVSVGEEAFLNCNSLEVVIIEQGVKYIESRAFENCKNLKRVYLPNTIESIAYTAFLGCDNLKEVICIEGLRRFECDWFNFDNNNILINIPKTVEEIEFDSWYGLNLIIDDNNPTYKRFDNFIINKKTKTLETCLSYDGDDCPVDVIIPEGIKVIKGARISVIQKELIIPEGIERICCGAFDLSGYIEEITIFLPSTLKHLEKGAFEYSESDSYKVKFVFQNGINSEFNQN